MFDPQERHNLIEDERCREVAGEMRARLERWMRQTDDPLLDGPVPLPEGARVSPPELVSPRDAR